MTWQLSERALILTPLGRDAAVATSMLAEIGVASHVCASVDELTTELERGAGFAVITEEALRTANVTGLSAWLGRQPEWSDMPFILLTSRGGGLERNPTAARYLELLGNVTFLERPFHPTTLVSIARSSLRARRRQYEARTRLETLHESEAQFRSLANSIPAICWIAQPDGHVYWYNQQMYDYTGTAPEDMRDGGWQRIHDPKLLPEIVEKWAVSLETGQPFEMVFPLLGKDGKYRPFLARSQAVRDTDGQIVRWLGTATDIQTQRDAEAALEERASELERRVEQRTAEREAALAQLHEAQKLETLGQLTGGVAHDFNNLLTPITGVLDLLQRKYGDGDEREARLIAGALQSADRAKTLVQRLLGFARRQALQTCASDVAALVEGMRELIASSIGPTIELQVSQSPDLPSAMVDPNQLELAILNLCVNARDAMPDGGSLTIELDRAMIGPDESPKLNPGTYLRLSVIDTGIGMNQDILRRAIEPFFSTKGIGKGTGLGLSMIHGLAGQLGGDLELSSTPGEGTRADLWLPAAERAQAAPPTPVAAAVAAAGRPLRILLVDDEELVRTGTAEMLRDLGHHVTEASNGVEALEVLGRTTDFDAVVTDYMMPRMNGAELTRQIEGLDPGMPILLITGYADYSNLDPKTPRLTKPFRQADLAHHLNAIVEKAR
ncbi:hybrid sensor histidine kinase/response regulator [Sphingosinicella rhizophila]|uniref:histidine kinase n=1 Tax=Sphingosinicella rhizophila TaxID=3050082 RepID=A0ABU3Q3Q8_9SPHN|nr:response regulator [Sphingosinicella sp. GR2756]MDT9597598.1 response regulator [Sphingosinicella sp. GR2756]